MDGCRESPFKRRGVVRDTYGDIEYLWGTYMGYLWGTCGVLMGYLWGTCGVLVGYLWGICGVLHDYIMANAWLISG